MGAKLPDGGLYGVQGCDILLDGFAPGDRQSLHHVAKIGPCDDVAVHVYAQGPGKTGVLQIGQGRLQLAICIDQGLASVQLPVVTPWK